MNERYKAFVFEYLKDKDPRKAAKKVGYKEEYGYSLLKKEEVISLIKEKEKHKKLSEDEIINDLALLKDICLGRVSVKEWVKGEEKEVRVFNPTCANKSLEMLGKHLGVFSSSNQEEEVSLKIEVDYGCKDSNE